MKRRSLMVEVRPQKLSGVLGQASTVKALRESRGKDITAWLFAGPPGGGKTTLARILAVSLNCPHQEEFGEPCDDCIRDTAKFQIYEIKAAEKNKVEDATELVGLSGYEPLPPTKRRVIILDEAQRLTAQAQQILLKPLEDGHKHTVWILCTSEPEKLSDALRRRCKRFDLKPLSDKTRPVLVARAAKAGGVKDVKKFYRELERSGLRNPGWILNALEQYSSGVQAHEALSNAGTDWDPNIFPLVQAMTRGNWSAVSAGLRDLQGDGDALRRLRGTTLSYLRTMLLNSKGSNRSTVAKALRLMANTSVSYEESLTQYAILAASSDVCDLFGKRQTKGMMF